tara:strand:+ start:7700 stop:9973 length:2274 start_codon:yes stop_codon:yes gene_type:complete
MLILNTPLTYLKNHVIFKIILIILIYIFLSASTSLEKEKKCDFDLFKYQNEISNISNIRLIQIDVHNHRKWVKEAMKIYTKSYTNAKFIEKKYKKFHEADLVVRYDFGKCKFKLKIRQNGDLFDHIIFENSKFRRSLDVKILNGNISGITRFKLFNPEARNGDNEIIVTELLREFNILSPRTQKIEVLVNGIKNNYLFQEKIVKEFLENFSRREGPIFEGSEEFIWNKKTNKFWENISLIKLDNSKFINNDYDKLELVLKTYSKLQDIYMDYATNTFIEKGETIVLDKKKLSNDSLKLLKRWVNFELLMIASNSGHGLRPHNRKFFWNSLENGFEPIFYDGTPLLNKDEILYTNEYVFQDLRNFIDIIDIEYLKKIISKKNDSIFYQKLKKKGVNLSEEDLEILLKKILNRLDKINLLIKNTANIQKIDLGATKLEKYKAILKKFNFQLITNTVTEINRDNKFIIIENCKINCVIEKQKINHLYNLLNNNKKIDDNQILHIDYKFNEDIKTKIIKLPFTTLNIIHAKNLKIKIIDDKTVEFNQTTNADWAVIKDSQLNDIKILFRGSEKGYYNVGLNEKNISNCLTFYNVTFDNTNLKATNNFCEDAINIISSKGNINSVEIKDAQFDALDIDFSEIKFNSININDAGNDCVDFSYGNYHINKITAFKCGDKGISVGENSNLSIDDAIIYLANFGVVSKDSSSVRITDSRIDKTKYCLAAYNKKKEFNGGYLEIKNNKCINFNNLTMIDNRSKILLN